MGINNYIKSGVLAAALAVFGSDQRAEAQIGKPGTIQTDATLEFTFPTTGPLEPPFGDATWIYWYNNPGNGTAITTDTTTDISNPLPGQNTSHSGSLMIVTPWSAAGGLSQNAFFGCFADNGSYNFSELADLTFYASIDFDILESSSNPLSMGSTNYGSITAGFCDTSFAFQSVGSVTIPSAASAGWVHLSVPINQALIGSSYNRYQPDIAFDVNNFVGYPSTNTTSTTFWLDNIELVRGGPPLGPPPTVAGFTPAVSGLNTIWTDPGANGQYNHYQVADTNDGVDGNDSFYGQASVTYSYTISKFPVADTAAQAHFFIVNGPDSAMGTNGVIPDQYDIAADYNLANCIYITVQSDGAGNGIMNLRWKTNDAYNDDQLISGNEPYLSFTNSPLLGTYDVTFTGGNVITFTTPNGNSASYTMPAAAAAMFDEANGPSTFLLGSQPNATTYAGDEVIYSSFSRTGNHAFTDNFATDTSLNTTHWQYFSSAPGVVIVPPTEAFWINVTVTPPEGYLLITSPTLGPTANWTGISPIVQFPYNGGEWTLVPAVSQTGFYQLVPLYP